MTSVSDIRGFDIPDEGAPGPNFAKQQAQLDRLIDGYLRALHDYGREHGIVAVPCACKGCWAPMRMHTSRLCVKCRTEGCDLDIELWRCTD